MLVIWAALAAAMKAAAAKAAESGIAGAMQGQLGKTLGGKAVMGGLQGLQAGGGLAGAAQGAANAGISGAMNQMAGNMAPLPAGNTGPPVAGPQVSPQRSAWAGVPAPAGPPPGSPAARAATAGTSLGPMAGTNDEPMDFGDKFAAGAKGFLLNRAFPGAQEGIERERRRRSIQPYVESLQGRLDAMQANPSRENEERRLELQHLIAGTRASQTPQYTRKRGEQLVNESRFFTDPEGRAMREEYTGVSRGGLAPSEYRSRGSRPLSVREGGNAAENAKKRLAYGVHRLIQKSRRPGAKPYSPILADYVLNSGAMNAYYMYYPEAASDFMAQVGESAKAGAKPPASPDVDFSRELSELQGMGDPAIEAAIKRLESYGAE